MSDYVGIDEARDKVCQRLSTLFGVNHNDRVFYFLRYGPLFRVSAQEKKKLYGNARRRLESVEASLYE